MQAPLPVRYVIHIIYRVHSYREGCLETLARSLKGGAGSDDDVSDGSVGDGQHWPSAADVETALGDVESCLQIWPGKCGLPS